MTPEPGEEILSTLPSNALSLTTVEEMIDFNFTQDQVAQNAVPPFSQVFQSVNEEFEKSSYTPSHLTDLM